MQCSGLEFKKFCNDSMYWGVELVRSFAFVWFSVDGKKLYMGNSLDIDSLCDDALVDFEGGVGVGFYGELLDGPTFCQHFKRWRKEQNEFFFVSECDGKRTVPLKLVFLGQPFVGLVAKL